jgi:uncharacterized lipoprotein
MPATRHWVWGLLFVNVFMMSACGLFKREHDRDYLQSKSITTFNMPDGMQPPPQNHQFDIPSSSVPLDQDVAKLDVLEKPPTFDMTGLDDEGLLDTSQKDSDTEALSVREARNTDGYNLLVVEAKFDQAWDTVGNALKQMGFTIEDSDRGEGIYSIYQSINRVMDEEEKFLRPRNDKGLREQYQIYLEDRENLTRIMVRTSSGKVDDSALAKHLLVQLRYELEHPRSKS